MFMQYNKSYLFYIVQTYKTDCFILGRSKWQHCFNLIQRTTAILQSNIMNALYLVNQCMTSVPLSSTENTNSSPKSKYSWPAACKNTDKACVPLSQVKCKALYAKAEAISEINISSTTLINHYIPALMPDENIPANQAKLPYQWESQHLNYSRLIGVQRGAARYWSRRCLTCNGFNQYLRKGFKQIKREK